MFRLSQEVGAVKEKSKARAEVTDRSQMCTRHWRESPNRMTDGQTRCDGGFNVEYDGGRGLRAWEQERQETE